jgi:mannose-6-phosphate isomerase-like protein (cupin superfamily)
MTISNISRATQWFEILSTTERCQTAVMTLAAGGDSSEEMAVHAKSDQVLYVVEGWLEAEVGGAKHMIREGDSCIVPAGSPHRFFNRGQSRAVTFNVYSPPAYPAGQKG